MARNKKPWVSKRKNRTGWWVGWYDHRGKRCAKQLPNKALADQFAARKTLELNDAYRPAGSAVPITWQQLVAEYIRSLRVRNLADSSVGRVELTLRTFAATMKILSPKQVTQRTIEDYILKARKQPTRFNRPPSEASINTDIRNLRGFVKWATDSKHPYLTGPFDLHENRVQYRKARTLTDEQVSTLLVLFNDDKTVEYPDAWRTRILLAAATGLRAGDIERLMPSDFDPSTKTVRTLSKKTKKEFVHRPIPSIAWLMIWPYVQNRLLEKRLFPDTFTSKKWTRIRLAAGLPAPLSKKEKTDGKAPGPTFHFHDLRIVFTSALAAKHVPTGIAQKLLEHSTPKLTNDVYTDFDPTLRPAVELIPVDKWIKGVNDALKLSKNTDQADSGTCNGAADSSHSSNDATE